MSSDSPSQKSSFQQGQENLRKYTQQRSSGRDRALKLIDRMAAGSESVLGSTSARLLATRSYENALDQIKVRMSQQYPDFTSDQIEKLAVEELAKSSPSAKGLINNTVGALTDKKKQKDLINKAKKARKVASLLAKGSNPVGWIWLMLEFLVKTKTGRIIAAVLCLCCSLCCFAIASILSNNILSSENLIWSLPLSPTLIECAGSSDWVDLSTCGIEKQVDSYSQEVYTDEV